MSVENQIKRVIALGFFDGIHRGHKALMSMANKRAEEKNIISAVFTFDIHPSALVSGKKIPFIVAPCDREMEIIRLGKVDEVIISHFDKEMQCMDWKVFVHEVLIKKYGAIHIITGSNNKFGYRGEGNAEKLHEECKKLGIGYDCIDDVEINGVTISSTHIRALISEGKMQKANEFLGHPYTVLGTVSHGQKLGRTIGFPTINIPFDEDMQKPPFGVYASCVVIDNKRYIAVTNIGLKPTILEEASPTVETHILDFSGDLYGKLLHVELYKFLRPEKKFSGVEELMHAIDENVRQTREFFREMK